MEGRQAWADQSVRSFLPSLVYRLIDTGHLPHLCIPLQRQSGKPTTDHQMTAPGVSDTLPATCFRICTCPVRHCRRNRGRYSVLAYSIMQCLAGPYNGKTTLSCDCMSCKHCMPVNHMTMQCTTTQKAEQYHSGVICRIYTRHASDVMLVYLT